MRTTLTIALALSLAACTASEDEPLAAQEEQIAYDASAYSAAIADAARPDADKESDETRKPGELLAFAQIDEGEMVGDYIMGGGYVTRLLASAVGENGKVYAFTPEEFVAFRAEYATEQDTVVADYENVEPLRAPIAAPGFPEPLDTIITVMNLHDLYIPQMPEGTSGPAIAALYAALKPGGKLVVVDHSAAAGTGTATTDATHRIDRQTVIDDLTAAGFELEAESALYARPDDPRDANVFDPAIRGKTDQFALRFSKPG
ncbi:MAG TPA: methyltransferase [Alteraurantiacibacter sp.]|jgi:predicted methyltransferase